MGLLEVLRRDGPDGARGVDPDTPLARVPLLALDLETTGLDPRRHEIVAVGHVPVLGGEVRLSGGRQRLVRPTGGVGESAVVHGLTDDVLAAAPPLSDVLPEVLEALSGTVLLAHFAQIERDFLGYAVGHGARARGRRRRDSPGWQAVDTWRLERVLLRAGPRQVPAGRLRLHACRRAHRLPRVAAHTALGDAIACAELFLAQSAELEHRYGRPLLLRDVLADG